MDEQWQDAFFVDGDWMEWVCKNKHQTNPSLCWSSPLCSFRRRSTSVSCGTDRERTSRRSSGRNYVSLHCPFLRRHHGLFKVSSADRTTSGHFVFIARRNNVFVIIIIVCIYTSRRFIEITFTAFSFLPLLLLLLLPLLFLSLIHALQTNNLIARLVVTTIVNELARVSERTVSGFLIILADL